jgi:lactoylglutathione lyase
MTKGTISELEQLQQGLAADPSGIEATLTTFSSGCAMLDVRRAGRGFVMAYAPAHGFGVDELHAGDGLVSGYRFVFKDFESAARKLRALAIHEGHTESAIPTLSLFVLRCADIHAAKGFYSLLGMTFAAEQHGNGPPHFSATIGSVVLEIYPCPADQPSAPVRIGFRVLSLDRTLAVLHSHNARILREAADSPWGRRAVVEDPDGNRIELTQA